MRLAASDLDGTIVRSDGTFSARTVAAVTRVEDAGGSFVVVTGRPVRWMAHVAVDLGHHGLAVCANGAVLYDLHAEEVVGSWLLASTAAREVAEALRAALPGIAFAVEHLYEGFSHEPAYRPRWDSADPLSQGPIEQLLSRDVVKLLARHEELGSDELLEAARTAVGEAAELTHSSSDGLLEISASGVSKASGLATVAEQRGVGAAGVVAFGDMPNDLPMLAWAGLGVAVANAHPEVLAVADEVTASNDADGVALVLERLFG